MLHINNKIISLHSCLWNWLVPFNFPIYSIKYNFFGGRALRARIVVYIVYQMLVYKIPYRHAAALRRWVRARAKVSWIHHICKFLLAIFYCVQRRAIIKVIQPSSHKISLYVINRRKFLALRPLSFCVSFLYTIKAKQAWGRKNCDREVKEKLYLANIAFKTLNTNRW